jgi:hypothetical protein
VIRPPILDRLKGVRRAGRGWLAFCPAHPDQHKRSLSVGLGDDLRTLVKCHAQACPAEKITGAVGMTLADLAPPPSGNGHRPTGRQIVSTYDYTDERGERLYQVVRHEPKDFRCRRPDGNGGWLHNLDGVRVVPYRLPELAKADRVFVTEGEKDVDTLVALGLVATCNHGGAGKWRTEHTSALVAAAVPEVVVLHDNDAAGEAHQRSVATSCATGGVALVKVLDLPDLPPKGDVSDYIAMQRAAGRSDEEIRGELLALADAAPVFTPGRDVEAAETPEASDAPGPRAQDVGEPQLQPEGLDFVLSWPGGPRFELRAVHDGSDGVHGQLGVFYRGQRLGWGNIKLASVSTRAAWRKQLESAMPGLPWRDYLEETAYRLTQAAREGEPFEVLTGAPVPPSHELLHGVLYEGEVCVLAGDGDTGKSMTAYAIAVAMETGIGLPGRLKPTRQVRVAVLDWETDRATADARVGQLAAGLGVDPPAVLYKRMTGPLYERARPLAAELARRGVGCVIIDSQQPAIAGGGDATFHEGAIQFFAALRFFAPAPVLVINHITNADARNGGAARPFGGAFSFNGPRLVWTARRDRNIEDATAVTFVNMKANNLPRRPDPFGLRFVPGVGTITVYPMDLREAAPSAVAGASLPYRIRLALAKGALTIAELAEQLDAKQDTVRRSLNRMKRHVVLISENKPQRWGLAQS